MHAINDRMIKKQFPSGSAAFLVFVALLLLAASALKLWEYGTTPSHPEHLLDASWVILGTSGAEILLAFWLIAGWERCAAKIISTVFFIAVACVTSYKWFSGEISCGCFGRVHAAPWIIALLDVVIVAGLLWHISSQTKRLSHPLGGGLSRYIAGGVLGIGVFTAFISVAAAAMLHPTATSVDGVTQTDGLVILEPEKWENKQFPIASFLDTSADFMHGNWRVVFFHNDCSDCQRIVPMIDEQARSTGQPTLLVEMPPYASAEISIVPRNTPCKLGKLDASKKWFATTPVILGLADGVVKWQQSGVDSKP